MKHIEYNHQEIEARWQDIWEEYGIDDTVEDSSKPKWYALTMFVYPSGDIHAGHWYAFTPSDVVARWKRMNGYNVFFPVGFDGFGLPAENAAIKRNIHPKEWTYKNIDRMRKQLRAMGAMWAWDRESITCDPDFYKWTQWLFLRLYEEGLAYREYAPVDWCPSCNTTLAREQVWGDDRHCERCRTPVIKKELEQWKLRITNYADELINDLEKIDWPSNVKVMQKNWIGRSDGLQVTFESDSGDEIEIFTTRPDTLWGASFIILAPEHPLVDKVTKDESLAAVNRYKKVTSGFDEIARFSTSREKTGVFTGSFAINPANEEEIPIWIADYVVMSYGTGAIMGVPAHDERDFQFAKTYGLKVRQVVRGLDEETKELNEVYSGINGIMINSGVFDGVSTTEGIEKVTAWLEKTGRGKKQVKYRLRDWLVSRQRMWGTPIPIIYCDSCGEVPVPYADLPIKLPDDAEFNPTGESPLKHHESFRYVECPNCGGKAERETDTLDTFMCSSWYQYAYVSPNHKKNKQISREDTPWDKTKHEYWLPVDQYTGGIEHATMHLLYTRFFTKALRDIGVVNFDEPMDRLFNQGMILGPDGEKMSKSRGNVINPDKFVQTYGADTVRGYMMFIGPWDKGGPWDVSGIEGIRRFLQRFWNLIVEDSRAVVDASEISTSDIERDLHQTILKVTTDIQKFSFNTAISTLMVFSNEMLKVKKTAVFGTPIWAEATKTSILLMAPLFPFISEELWYFIGNRDSVHMQTWPVADTAKLRAETVTVIVQVNGKLRDKITVAVGITDDSLKELVLAKPNVKKWVDGNSISRFVIVQNKIINIVLAT